MLLPYACRVIFYFTFFHTAKHVILEHLENIEKYKENDKNGLLLHYLKMTIVNILMLITVPEWPIGRTQ